MFSILIIEPDDIVYEMIRYKNNYVTHHRLDIERGLKVLTGHLKIEIVLINDVLLKKKANGLTRIREALGGGLTIVMGTDLTVDSVMTYFRMGVDDVVRQDTRTQVSLEGAVQRFIDQGKLRNISAYRPTEKIRYCQEKIEECIVNSKSMNLNDLARMCDWTTSHLSRTFKLYVGKKLKYYQIEIKMTYLCAELKMGKVSVKQLAEKYQYSDEASLMKSFNAYMGMTIGQYSKFIKSESCISVG